MAFHRDGEPDLKAGHGRPDVDEDDGGDDDDNSEGAESEETRMTGTPRSSLRSAK